MGNKIIKLTESDLVNLVKQVINEQNNTNINCLIKAGFKKETIGGPMVRRTVYSTTIDGMTYQYSEGGYVRVFNGKSHKTGNWSCDASAPNGVRVYNLKERRMTPF